MKRFLLFLLLPSLFFARESADELKARVRGTLPAIPGWCSEEKAMEFIDLILEAEPAVYVEIGIFGGASLFPAASALKFLGKGTAIGIDPWDKVECLRFLDPEKNRTYWNWWSRLNLRSIEASFYRLLAEEGLEDSVEVLRMPSSQAASLIERIDILHLDGNAGEEGILDDVRSYLPKIAPGGFIWLNDALSPARQEAQDLLLEQCDLMKAIDKGNCLLFRKRPI